MPYYKRQDNGTSNFKSARIYKATSPTSLKTMSDAYSHHHKHTNRRYKKKSRHSDVRVNKVVT